MLLARHRSAGSVEADIAALTTDPAPLVRRAAVASLAQINPADAAAAARPLLADPVWFVRAHAARAIGETEDPEFARDIAPLLADREWWVRTAAKESLQRMGPEVWSALVPYLDHADAFARNGAAEVLQNIGILDSLIILEAATVRPSAEKIDMLRKIASAGGTRMTEALLDRVDQETRPRVRDLLASLGLEPAGAHS
jgi:HEAT repeat protein